MMGDPVPEAPYDSPLGRYLLNGGYATLPGKLVVHDNPPAPVTGAPGLAGPVLPDLLREAAGALRLLAAQQSDGITADDYSERVVAVHLAQELAFTLAQRATRIERTTEHAAELVQLPGWRTRLTGRVADARDRAAAAVSEWLRDLADTVYPSDTDEEDNRW